MIKAFAKNIQMAKYVLKYCPSYFMVSVFYIIMRVIIPVSEIYLVKYVVASVADLPNMNADDIVKKVIIIIVIYFAITIVANTLITIYEKFLMGRYRIVYFKKMQNMIYQRAKIVDMKDFDNPEFYDLYSRALRDGMRRGINVYEQFVRFFCTLATTFAVGTIIILSDPILIGLLFVSSIATVIIRNIINKIEFKCYKRTEKNRRMHHYVNRTFYHQRFAAEIKTTPISDLLIEKYKENVKTINKEYVGMQKRTGMLDVLNQTIRIIFEYASKYIYLGWKLFEKQMDVAMFTSTINAAGKFTSNFTATINFFTVVHQNSLYIDDFLKYLSYSPTLEKTGTEQITGHLEKLTVDDITFRYTEAQNNTINNINLEIKKGEKLAIVGLNGAGKTTLIKLLLKLYNINSGNIFFNNQEYRTLDENSIRGEYAIIFQDYQVYAQTIAENVLMRVLNSKEDEELVCDCLKKVGLYERVMNLPDNIHSLVTREFDNNGVVFSGGERQKLVIARVFASNASIYILDEPTSSLDPYAEKEINDLIMEKAKDKTIILIAHRLSTVVDADRIILIENGRIIEDGNHSELIKKNGIYCKMFNTQASLYKKNNYTTEQKYVHNKPNKQKAFSGQNEASDYLKDNFKE